MATMFGTAFLIVGACVLSAKAVSGSSDGCLPETPPADGWNFLTEGTQYQMRKRNFIPPGGENTRCLSSTPEEKDTSKYRVNAKIRFLTQGSTSWQEITQKYQFSKASATDNYNIMNTTTDSAKPQASYEFIYTSQHCAVVIVRFLGPIDAAPRTASQASDETKSEEGTKCVLWVPEGKEESEDPCCESLLATKCGGKFDIIYDKRTCNSETGL
uniref:Lipocalin n=1 Tax=Rhipicephalus zambeziensis TaxID=60191 RepID=A0A224YLK3_9ACAR